MLAGFPKLLAPTIASRATESAARVVATVQPHAISCRGDGLASCFHANPAAALVGHGAGKALRAGRALLEQRRRVPFTTESPPGSLLHGEAE